MILPYFSYQKLNFGYKFRRRAYIVKIIISEVGIDINRFPATNHLAPEQT